MKEHGRYDFVFTTRAQHFHYYCIKCEKAVIQRECDLVRTALGCDGQKVGNVIGLSEYCFSN